MSTSAPPPPAGDAAARQALLTGLAQGLKLLADRVLPHANAAIEVAELAARAEELAHEAWKQSGDRTADPGAARALAEAFQEFIAEATALSARAARSAAATREVGATMADHAGELTKLASGSTPPDLPTLRTALRPIVVSLEQLPIRMAESRAMADDVAGLGSKAGALGAQAMNPQTNARNASAQAMAMYRSLRTLGDEAAALAATMQSDADRVRKAIGGIASHAGRLATAGAAAPPPPTAATRIAQVVTQGQAIEWGAVTRRA